jgi:hypothetical protein
MSLEEFISALTKEDLELINKEFEKRQNKIPSLQFSKIRDIDLKKFVIIKENLSREIFKTWFNYNTIINSETELFLKELIDENEILIKSYKEEDLKIYFISPLLNKINFKSFENEIRGYYEEKLTYKTEKFIFSGTTDFLVSKGLTESEKPYFFIQEFKRAEEYSNPRPQLLAELITGVELNNWKFIKGAYVIGAIWNFVILEKLGKDKYQYFISQNFDCTKIEDLKDIYKNLCFVKNEIFQMVKTDKF